ncbi:hypothetical protein BU200_03910 [Streptococcus acidominimus]|nr:hypothetical protein BU200_03910 [Streptococcus acidominimus]
MDKVQAAQERDRVRFEALAAEERKTQGWIDLALGAVTIAVGVAAIVASGGAATPLVAGAWIAGSGTIAYGLSNTVEAGHNLYLGYQGDGKTHATNPIRDTLFMGNDKTYHQVGGLFTTASAVLIPIGKTQSLAKGLTEFMIGEVGGFAGHQAAYHGTKLLGGSEADAQRASFVGSILGGYAASSAAAKFSLNTTVVKNSLDDVRIPSKPQSTTQRFHEISIVEYADNMSQHYTQTDIDKLTELTTHNSDSKTALLGYFEPDSVMSYEQIAYANNLTYFDAGANGWNAIAKVDPNLAYKVNDEFLMNQIREGKDFVLTSNPFKARDIADTTGRGVSYANEIDILANTGYKIEQYGSYWRAYK